MKYQQLNNMKKKLIVTTLIIAIPFLTMACPTCERNQPKILKGIVHGSGPESNWDYISMYLISIITIITLFYSIKYLIKPGEKNTDHIKFTILK